MAILPRKSHGTLDLVIRHWQSCLSRLDVRKRMLGYAYLDLKRYCK